jgi:hypothetical protein
MGPVLVFLMIVAVAPVTLAIIDSFSSLKLATLSRGCKAPFLCTTF